MKHGSLFSGIGGFDLAAEWAGWDNIFHCEWNEFGKKILSHYWPNAISYDDITKTDFTIHRGRIDVITGGFPCQPYSAAGKRLGKEDERHLWPEMLRAIREIAPRWVVGENVRGLTNWNGGVVFDEVQADMEAIGYEVLPFLLPACAKDAPHRRDRIWFVAYRNSIGCDNGNDNRQERPVYNNEQRNTAQGKSKWAERELGLGQVCSDEPTPHTDRNGHEPRRLGEDRPKKGTSQADEQKRKRVWHYNRGTSKSGVVANANGSGRKEQHFTAKPSYKKQFTRVAMHTNSASEQGQYIRQTRKGQFNRSDSRDGVNDWQNFPTQPPICSGNDGLPTELDGITFPKWRNESIKAYGNAVVPQVVYEIFKAINKYEKQ